jgi:hypothetical protein
LYFGRDTDLNFGGHAVVCNPMESDDLGSTNCETPLPAKKSSFLGSSVLARILVW